MEEIYFSLNNKMGTSSPLHSKLRTFKLIIKKDIMKTSKHENGVCIVIHVCLILAVYSCKG
jgi:hypothetical protein